MAKRKPEIVSAGGMDPRNEQDLKPLIDEVIAKIRSIDQVGHMFYVKTRVEEALILLHKLKASA